MRILPLELALDRLWCAYSAACHLQIKASLRFQNGVLNSGVGWPNPAGSQTDRVVGALTMLISERAGGGPECNSATLANSTVLSRQGDTPRLRGVQQSIRRYRACRRRWDCMFAS
jgi:hypothetical protein